VIPILFASDRLRYPLSSGIGMVSILEVSLVQMSGPTEVLFTTYDHQVLHVE
jgi:hypothetical protein